MRQTCFECKNRKECKYSRDIAKLFSKRGFMDNNITIREIECPMFDTLYPQNPLLIKYEFKSKTLK